MLSGGNEGSKEDERLKERKVYSRKSSSKNLQNSNLLSEQQHRVQPRSMKRANSAFDLGSDNFSRDFSAAKGGVIMLQENKVSISLSMRSKREALELRSKLEGERDMVRSLMRRIEVNGGQRSAAPGFGGEVGPPRASKPLNQLSVSVFENSKTGGADSGVEKEKRTPKANKFYRNSEFLLAKDKFPPAESNKKLKLNGKKGGGSEVGLEKFPNQVNKACTVLLERLMKHKHGWVFNKPVDVAGLGLHDYFEVIKNPMDLGTVKNRLSQNWYNSPVDFAKDVRLTFENAMAYNPKGQDVYVMAEQLSKVFEDKWAPIEADYMRELKKSVDLNVGSPRPKSRKAPPQPRGQPDVGKSMERSESISYSVDPKRKKVNVARKSSKVHIPKKPKAKDPNKREMTYDEKQKLSEDLQDLPSDKLENVVHIIKKRNPSVSQEDDEIEVDIDNVDTETLWELDRFITNYKKNMSKNKRKAEFDSQLITAQENTQEKIATSIVKEKSHGNRTDEEKVVSPPAQVEGHANEKDEGGTLTGSSSDLRSSSSDSDGDSSSEDGSDDEHSPKT